MKPDRKLPRTFFKLVILSMLSEHQKGKDSKALSSVIISVVGLKLMVSPIGIVGQVQ